MSVVRRKIVFCEGSKDSLDRKLLDRLKEESGISELTIVPSGSKFTFSIFAKGYFSGKKNTNQRYLVFRDRDFDCYPNGDPKLLQINNNSKFFLSHRACVENYLLDPNLIYQYWSYKYREQQENPQYKWGHGDSPSIEEITSWIRNSAEQLKEYQTVRWALADLIKPSRRQLKTTWTKGSGKLPEPQFLDLQHCISSAEELIRNFTEDISSVTLDKFRENIETYQLQFEQEEFWNSQGYLIWFHGKDLQKMMQKEKPDYISLQYFFKWAIENLNISQHPDLLELKGKIEQL